MRRFLIIFLICGIAVGSCHEPKVNVPSPSEISMPTLPNPLHHHHHHKHKQKPWTPAPPQPVVAPQYLPDPSLTPGTTFAVTTAEVCTLGYASSVRDVPSSLNEAVYTRYGVAHTPYAHEVDHLVSLELGGSNSIENLWPEPYAGRWGARTKDALENRLHSLVCSGAMTLSYAQTIEASNWIAAYRRYM